MHWKSCLHLLLLLHMATALATNTASATTNVTLSPTVNTSRSISVKSSDSQTQTHSHTFSLDLPVQQAYVTMSSSVLLPSRCLVDVERTKSNTICRRLRFVMHNDGFIVSSSGLTSAVARRILSVDTDERPNPFGLASMWEFIQLRLEVASNITHLDVQFPRLGGLVVPQPETIRINFTDVPQITMRGTRMSSESAFTIVVVPDREMSVLWALSFLQFAAGILGVISVFLPFAPALNDVQVAVMSGMSLCMQPDIKKLCVEGQRLLFPAVEPNATMGARLSSNLLIVVGVGLAHLLLLSFTMLKNKWKFWKAASSAFFPSGTLAVLTIILPGIVLSSVALLIGNESTGMQRLFGFFGLSVAAILYAVPTVFSQLYFTAQRREHTTALYNFPSLLRFYIPECSWGPNDKLRLWMVPFGAASRRKWAHATPIYVSLVAVFGAFEPSSASGCARLYFFIAVVAAVNAVLTVKFQFFRSRYINVSSCAASLILVPAMLVSAARCLEAEHNPKVALVPLYFAIHSCSAARSILAIISFVLEHRIIRPVVWPDRKEETIHPDTPFVWHITTEKEVAANVEERMKKKREIPLEMVAEAENYEAPATHFIHHLRSGSNDGEEGEEEGEEEGKPPSKEKESRKFKFGEPLTFSRSGIPKLSQVSLSTSMSLRHPMQSIVRGDGPMPPAMMEERQYEYMLL